MGSLERWYRRNFKWRLFGAAILGGVVLGLFVAVPVISQVAESDGEPFLIPAPPGMESRAPPNAAVVHAEKRAELAASFDRSMSQTVAEVAAATSLTAADVVERSNVSIVFRQPLPYLLLNTASERGVIPDNAITLTAYLELEDGYPIVVKGRPGTDFESKFGSTLALLEERATSDDAGSAYDPGFTALVRRARADVADRIVIIAYTQNTSLFLEVESSLKAESGEQRLAGFELKSGTGGNPIKPVDHPYDAVALNGFAKFWEKELQE